eukprot:7514778-Pyramimonas_sp.AAC.1
MLDWLGAYMPRVGPPAMRRGLGAGRHYCVSSRPLPLPSFSAEAPIRRAPLGGHATSRVREHALPMLGR